MPVTAPPLKARSKAFPSPDLAAAAVFTLARTEMLMPTKPANAEETAPAKNVTAVGTLTA